MGDSLKDTAFVSCHPPIQQRQSEVLIMVIVLQLNNSNGKKIK